MPVSGAVMQLLELLEPRRLLSAGDLDPAFNGGNVLRIDHPSDEYLNLLGQLSDGRLVLVGETDNGDDPGRAQG